MYVRVEYCAFRHSYDFGVELLSRNTPTIAGTISNVVNLDIGRYDFDVDTWHSYFRTALRKIQTLI